MDLSSEIKGVYERALLLRQRATETPIHQDLLDAALKELLFVLEELQTSQEELRHQNEELIATRQWVEIERQRYQFLFEFAPDGYLVTDRQGKIYKANQAASRLFSTSKEYLLKKPLIIFIHETDRSLFQSRLASLQQNQEWEISINSNQGSLKRVAVAVSLIPGIQRNKDALLWSFRDISQGKQREKQIQLARNPLEKQEEEGITALAKTNEQMNVCDRAELKIHEQVALIDIATEAIFVQDQDYSI
jgi:PAS domain S-box-containing protein